LSVERETKIWAAELEAIKEEVDVIILDKGELGTLAFANPRDDVQ
jgi:hypothetical protein